MLDGTNPTILYGYGGYGISMRPGFLGARTRLWLDGGGVYAIAIIRGGGEFGEPWHLAGNLTKKQNVFDDFAAAARHLVERKYTTPAKLAIFGESNGGLLMGATLTQHPELFRAVVSRVGIYDMLRVELGPNGEFNTTEFGTVKDPEQFKALYAYSPYHHVAPGRPLSRRSSSRPAKTTAASSRGNRENSPRRCRRRPAPACRCCCASTRPATAWAHPATSGSRRTPTSWRSCTTSSA